MRRLHAATWLLASLFLSQVNATRGADHLLTIGGGPTIENNQISLENNVKYLRRALDRLKLTGIRQKILFSDGGNPEADLQFEAEYDPEDLRIMLAEFIGPSNDVAFNYRSSLLPIVDGPAEPGEIEETLKQYRVQLKNGDRLLIYFTGHGGRAKADWQSFRSGGARRGSGEDRSGGENTASASGSRPSPVRRPPRGEGRSGGRGPRREAFANNIIHLWNDTEMSVTEWTEKLDRLPPEVPVYAVMVQCYSGGFANFIFKGGNPANGLAPQPRCGFFATVPDRVAGGCTPKVDEAEYREYSSYFFEALCGESRTGQSVARPDYDRDGRTSFLEAHAYTVLTADTIDIPVRTSDIYLREVSTTRGRPNLLTASSPVDDLLAVATPVERAVVEGLSRRFQMTFNDRATQADELIAERRAEKDRLDEEVSEHRLKVGTITHEIGAALKRRWPVINSPWSPETARLVTEESAAVKGLILNHSRYGELKAAQASVKEASARSDEQELQIVKLERLKYWLETLALKANLTAQGGRPDEQAALRRIVEMESAFLTPGDPTAKTGTAAK